MGKIESGGPSFRILRQLSAFHGVKPVYETERGYLTGELVNKC